MSRSSKFVSVILTITLILVATSTAIAGPPTDTQEVVDGRVTWTIPPNQCAAAPNGLSGSGARHTITTTRINADGSTTITIDDGARGRAWDATGTYDFIYLNHSVEDIPVGGGTHRVHMLDKFLLDGNGSVGHMAVGFNWRWTYTPPEEIWPPVHNWQQIATRGDPLNCDPI